MSARDEHSLYLYINCNKFSIKDLNAKKWNKNIKVKYSWLFLQILAKEAFLSMTAKSEIIKKYIPRCDCEKIHFLHIKQL